MMKQQPAARPDPFSCALCARTMEFFTVFLKTMRFFCTERGNLFFFFSRKVNLSFTKQKDEKYVCEKKKRDLGGLEMRIERAQKRGGDGRH